MYGVGEEEIEALARVIRTGALFRYGVGEECDLFERRYAEYLGCDHAALTASGSNALTAAMIGLGLGPGVEVLIPAHTYMATALAVLAVGAIPVIVDIDETATIDPEAVRDSIGPRTKAVIPVHMWGASSNMDAIMSVAQKHDLFVIEDACQAVGGGYEGRMLGTIGHVGAFSFNYYKNMTAGEGGAVVTNDPVVAERARCAIDPCRFYWLGRDQSFMPFATNGARASELMGAMLNVQLDRLPNNISAMRAEKKRILADTAHLTELGLKPTPMNSPDYECATQVMYTFPTAVAAEQFVNVFPSVILGKTGRHNYTEWDQVLLGEGGPHPRMNPFNMPENAGCRRTYNKEMCQASLDILDRTVMVATDPRHGEDAIRDTVHNIEVGARVALGELSPATAEIRNAVQVDGQKFDMVRNST